MTPSHSHSPHAGRTGQVLASALRIQSLVALIVGGTLALIFALGGHFGRVAVSLGLMAYGLGSLAYVTHGMRRQPGLAARAAGQQLTGPTPGPPALSSSGRVIPIARSLRTRREPADEGIDQIAGR